MFIGAEGDGAGDPSSFTECGAELWAAIVGTVVVGAAAASMARGIVFRCTRCFSSISRRLFRVKGFGRTSSIPKAGQQRRKARGIRKPTMLEILLDIIAPDVGCHGDYGRSVKLANKMACGNSIQVWHDDIHQD